MVFGVSTGQGLADVARLHDAVVQVKGRLQAVQPRVAPQQCPGGNLQMGVNLPQSADLDSARPPSGTGGGTIPLGNATTESSDVETD